MSKRIKNRIEALEAAAPQDNDHEYLQVITWEENDRITSRYYKDGVEITASQYRREYKPSPGEKNKINISWEEVDHEQISKE
jgi:hypothetical protein